MSTYPSGKSGSNICPQCNRYIHIERVGDSMMPFNSDRSIHHCTSYIPKPIGEAVEKKIIKKFILRKRRITLILSDINGVGMTLELSASLSNRCPKCDHQLDDELVAMNMTLVTPDGVQEEKK